MMRKWRRPQFMALALVALLCSVMPSLAWACSAAHCLEDGGALHVAVERCHDTECAGGIARCCKPLQLPADSGTPSSPVQKQLTLESLSASLEKPTLIGSIPAVLPATVLSSEAQPIVAGYLSNAPCLVLTPTESPPLPGRSPPLF